MAQRMLGGRERRRIVGVGVRGEVGGGIEFGWADDYEGWWWCVR